MKLEYDKEVDAAYIYLEYPLKEREAKKTIQLNDNIILDFDENNKLLGAILVSPSYTDLGLKIEKQSGYFNRSWQWDKIKENQKWIVQFGSKDDPYISLKEFRHIHKMLSTEYYEFENRGHFLQETFPEIVKVIKEKIK